MEVNIDSPLMPPESVSEIICAASQPLTMLDQGVDVIPSRLAKRALIACLSSIFKLHLHGTVDFASQRSGPFSASLFLEKGLENRC